MSRMRMRVWACEGCGATATQNKCPTCGKFPLPDAMSIPAFAARLRDESAHENAKMRGFKAAYNARRENIPLRILTQRGELSIHQALAAYLCDDPAGPRMTQADAATALGLNARQEIAMHLARARAKRA